MYTTSTSQAPPPPAPAMGDNTILPDGVDFKELLERLRAEQSSTGVVSTTSNQKDNHSLGRVVFGQSHWAREIVNHPA
jgi:hypothetical protein